MTRRFEVGPALVALGALALLVSLFLDWYEPGLDAWASFEVVDLLLTVLALAAAAGALGLLAPGTPLRERRWIPPLVVAALVLVLHQLLDPPPAVPEERPETGAWLALGSTLLMAAGAVLTFGRLRLAVTVEGRDLRRRVPAVDARPGGERPPGGAASFDALGADSPSRREARPAEPRSGDPLGDPLAGPPRRGGSWLHPEPEAPPGPSGSRPAGEGDEPRGGPGAG